jgi:hypothetical protein
MDGIDSSKDVVSCFYNGFFKMENGGRRLDSNVEKFLDILAFDQTGQIEFRGWT